VNQCQSPPCPLTCAAMPSETPTNSFSTNMTSVRVVTEELCLVCEYSSNTTLTSFCAVDARSEMSPAPTLVSLRA
jgi:hypothetical protein